MFKKGEGKTGISRNTAKRKKNVDPDDLQRELELYRQEGISLNLEGYPSNPSEIVQAHLIAEEGGYMRDYMQNEKGEIQKIDFDKININGLF